jgi:regulator of protease activity HflC (stomatin/prohibitin superfamily)
MPTLLFGLTCLILVAALFAISGIRIAQEYERGVIFRLGRFKSVRGPGIYWIIPLIERQRLIDIRTVTIPVEQQETITKDSVTVKVDAVLWYRIVDPAKSVIAVANYRDAVHQVALTSLRNIIGQHVLDEVLKERDSINSTLRSIVDTMTEPWGVQVEIVEMKDVEIPQGMQRAMAREAEAIREKRARIIKAEAELEASEKLSLGAKQIEQNPAALELRRMQMISEVGAEQNSTTIILMPSDFVMLSRELTRFLDKHNPKTEETKN